MFTLVLITLRTVRAVFSAEFAAGIVHWFEDAYVSEDTPLIGRYVARPNIVHHHYPRYMTRHTWWQSWAIYAFFRPSSCWALGIVEFSHGRCGSLPSLARTQTESVKWAHRTAAENGRVISFLQNAYILQGAKHHALHHTDPKNSHYCTITNFLNPVLDGIRFWDGAEWLLTKTVGLERRRYLCAWAWLVALRG